MDFPFPEQGDCNTLVKIGRKVKGGSSSPVKNSETMEEYLFSGSIKIV